MPPDETPPDDGHAGSPSSAQPAPFIPPSPEESPLPPSVWRVFGSKAYLRLWMAQVVSSLGDWIGILAILNIASRVSSSPGAAVSLVMVARMLPGFLLATVGGALIDRWDRRKVMVITDIGRAGLLIMLPFFDSLLALVVVSFLLEILTLLWSPAKEASVPNLVDNEQLASANSLTLVASYGSFPLGGLVFASMAALAQLLGNITALKSLKVDQEFLALWLDAAAHVVAAVLIFRLPLGRASGKNGTSERIHWTQTFKDIGEGIRFMAKHRLVRAVIVGLGVGLIGGGMMIPLGPVFAKDLLGGGAASFSLLMVALGMGAAVGVVTLLALQKRLPRETVFSTAVIGSGLCIIAAASFSNLGGAGLFIAGTGAFAGTSYVTGFTVLQETVVDELRGRTFGTLYTVIRLCLLLSLTVSPLFSELFGYISKQLLADRTIHIVGISYGLPGVRLAMWFGGLIAVGAGLFARWEMHRAHFFESERGEPL